jgi:hypothetical protein
MKKQCIGAAGLFLLITAPAIPHAQEDSKTTALQIEHDSTPAGTQPSAAEGDGLEEKLAARVKFSGLVEVEAFAGKDFLKEKTSDVSLATVELGLDAKISQWVSAHVLALYEEGEEDDHLIIDEGTITLSDAEKTPFYLTVGKMYVPFGSFASSMVSDPLTLELAETRDTGLLAGFDEAGWYGSLYTFNGEVDETGKDDTINSFGANLGYKLEKDGWQLDLGAGWLNNLGNSNTIRDHIATTSITVEGFAEALALHGGFRCHGWSFMAEYIAALDSFQSGEVDFNGRGARPKAWQLEMDYTTEVSEREITLALGYQRTEESLALGLPEHRYLASVGIGVYDHATLALEYRHDQDYATAQGGTDENAHQVVAQLAVEF